MADLPTLPLKRVEFEAPRRKKPGFGALTPRKPDEHAANVDAQIRSALEAKAPFRPPGIDPALILRLDFSGLADEDALKRAGLTVIGRDSDKSLVLFSSEGDLRTFREQVAKYGGGPPPKQVNPPYAGLIANINKVGRIQPVDRLGRLIRASGVTKPEEIEDARLYTLDVELWHTGDRGSCKNRIDKIGAHLESKQGKVTDSYVGSSLVLARIKAKGSEVRQLLEMDEVAMIDLPPKVTLRVQEELAVKLDELGDLPAPDADAPSICTLDSGVAAGHPLLKNAVGEATAVPDKLGDGEDVHGHGTMVAGLALYEDVEQRIAERRFVPMLRLFSARVLNADLEFDDEALITTQMRQAIEYFKSTYGCRVYNASLGDPRTPYRGGRVSPWASVLDSLARDLDVVIVVSAGNYEHEPAVAGDHDDHLTGYPRYLLEPPAKVTEPATGCVVLTVGSLSDSAEVPPGGAGAVDLRPIAAVDRPSPFTRSGPGIQGAIKPELCAVGGNKALNGLLKRAIAYAPHSVVSTGKNHSQRLFSYDVGTSFAAPRVAHLAARLLTVFPQASANLIRALLASSAEVPSACEDLLLPVSKAAVREVCGYGVPSFERASSSAPNRVVLVAEHSIAADQFHVYEVPIPQELYEGQGERRISVSLGFDPPVRHSRLDYLGTTMSFRLIRGKTIDEVVKAFKWRPKDAPKVEAMGSPNNCPMNPTPTEREGGTLQKAVLSLKKVRANYGDTYFLVVRCQREWAPDEAFPQRYAIVVTVEHALAVDLYARIEQRVRVPVQVRV